MILRPLLALAVGAPLLLAQRLPDNFDPVRAEREGAELTRQLLAQAPASNYTNTGTLEIRARGSETIRFPIRFSAFVDGDHWTGLYEALVPQTNAVLNVLAIVNTPGQPARYYRGRPGPDTALTDTEIATLSFAGSDYRVGDLGLDFLRWPVQRLLKKELRRGQACNVLESVHPRPPAGAPARVVSWLDIDTGGIVFAEAYDSNGKRVKEFAPKSFKKVDGEWQLEEMRIEDLITRSRSTIYFDVGEK